MSPLKAIVGAIRRRPGLELVDRARIDGETTRVSLEVLGEFKAGDVLVGTFAPGARTDLAAIRHVKLELERWVRRNAPGAEVLVVSDELTLGVHEASVRRLAELDRRLAGADAVLAELEEHVDRWEDQPKAVNAAAKYVTFDLLSGYAETLAQGITALRYVLEEGTGGDPDEAAEGSTSIDRLGGEEELAAVLGDDYEPPAPGCASLPRPRSTAFVAPEDAVT